MTDQLEFIMSIIEGDSFDKIYYLCVMLTNNIYNQIVEEKDEYFKFIENAVGLVDGCRIQR